MEVTASSPLWEATGLCLPWRSRKWAGDWGCCREVVIWLPVEKQHLGIELRKINHFLSLSWSFSQSLLIKIFFPVFFFFSQSNMAFMQGLVMKRDKKPARVFRALLGGLDSPPAKARSRSRELKPLITECFGRGGWHWGTDE